MGLNLDYLKWIKTKYEFVLNALPIGLLCFIYFLKSIFSVIYLYVILTCLSNLVIHLSGVFDPHYYSEKVLDLAIQK